MFTGIIEEKGKVQAIGDNQLILSRPTSFKDVSIGSSIAVAGVCLSIVAMDDTSLTFDVMDETLRMSALKDLKTGDLVNLERAMRADARFEGHIVQGHTEGIGEIIHIEKEGSSTLLTIRLPKETLSSVVSKGSIALDGVSLTVVSVEDDACRVALIPHTMGNTTLGDLKVGDCINIETDVLGRYVHALAS